VAIRSAGQSVDYFVECAVAATGDDQLPTFHGGALGYFDGIAGAGGFGQLGFDAGGSENAAGFIQHLAAALSALSGVGVVDQQGVLQGTVQTTAYAVVLLARFCHGRIILYNV
jgi:hypothetical protein